jgi:hypothetical protein
MRRDASEEEARLTRQEAIASEQARPKTKSCLTEARRQSGQQTVKRPAAESAKPPGHVGRLEPGVECKREVREARVRRLGLRFAPMNGSEPDGAAD